MPDDILRDGEQPEAPTKPCVSADAMDEYFQSVEEPFHETRDGLAKEREGVNGGFIAFFIFSLIPLIPYAASELCWWYFASTFFSIGRIHFHLASFWFWWIAFFVISLAGLLLAVKFSGVSTDAKKRWLCPPQMRFAYCYAVVSEIHKYKTNQLPRHIETALEYLDNTGKSLLPRIALPMGLYPDEYWARQIRFPQEGPLGADENSVGPPRWYRLRPETEVILKAFDEFKLKLRDRLKDRKDLPAIETALTCLASYQYLEIPELSDSKSETRFEEGVQSLVGFAQQVTSLAPYRSEQLKATPRKSYRASSSPSCRKWLRLSTTRIR